MIWLPGVLSQGGKEYVWERYALTKVVVTGGTKTGSISIGATTSYGTGYTFDENTGKFTITGAKTGNTDEYADLGVGSVTYHDSHSNNLVYDLGKKTFTTIYEWTITSVTSSKVTWNSKALTSGQGKGTFIDTVVSSNASDYPQNGERDGYWYVFIGVGSGGSDTPDVPPGINYVDYLQSTGTQCLDTAYVPNANTRVEMTFQLTTPDDTNQAIFAVAGQFSFRWYGASGCFRTNGSNNVDFSTIINSTAKHTVVKTATKTTIDDTYNANTTAGSVTLSLYLFGQHVSTGLQNPAKVKIFGCKIYESNVLVHDYRPCLDPDGVACMYDEVNTEYVYNAGSGTFAYGMAA